MAKNLILSNKFKIISILEIIIGLIFFILELVSVRMAIATRLSLPKEILALVSFEFITSAYVIFWLLLFVAGVSYWFNKKVYWLLSQVFFSMCILVIYSELNMAIFERSLFLFCFILLDVWILKIKSIDGVCIDVKLKICGTVLGILTYLSLFYWFSDYLFSKYNWL